eukprot:m.245102 g.245102  ORF g.245102 m.245102 type:complete len:327 (-) comp15358_c0_seq1:3717-4697(-)
MFMTGLAIVHQVRQVLAMVQRVVHYRWHGQTPSDMGTWLLPAYAMIFKNKAKHHQTLVVDTHEQGDQAVTAPVYVVGDVHGCVAELKCMLDKLPENAHIILAGDLINKGPASFDVIDIVAGTLRTQHSATQRLYAIVGNHDVAALAYHRRFRQLCAKGLTVQQALNVIPSHWQWVQHISDEQDAVLADLPFSIRLPQFNSLVVHAGLVPNVPVESQSLDHLILMRNVRESHGVERLLRTVLGLSPYVASATTPGKERPDEVPWASAWQGPEKVYFGHDAIRGLQLAPHAIGLDTGCVYGRSLTAINIVTGDLVVVPAIQPDEQENR